MARSGDLQKLRDAIEAVDREILAGLRARMQLVEKVAAVKLQAAVPLRDRLREEQVLGRIRRTARRLGLDSHEIERVYRVILEMSVARQVAHVRSRGTAPLRVAYQGVEGSYSHLTAQRRYAGRKGGVLLAGCESFREAVMAVRSGAADLALLPIENTTAGSIDETYDLLAEGGLCITAEVVTAVEHCLLGLPGATIEGVRTVISHPQALAQCDEYLARLGGVRRQAVFDTAGAARMVREEADPSLAAIASESAARNFGLEVLRRGVQSQAGNYTRFVEVALEAPPCPPGSRCKTSLLLVLEDRPNALGSVLGHFGSRGVNLTKLESRPQPGAPWHYRFYMDIQGHCASRPVAEALTAIRPLTTELRVLGTYLTAGTPGASTGRSRAGRSSVARKARPRKDP
ncbi:MAG: prephenate dehydratase [Deltaproteobacteria bacterium]|nr:prephenate dehydratase [Deltaproteobacteria bacterium]